METNDQAWYSTAIEKMGVFRYHIFQITKFGAKYTENGIVHLTINEKSYNEMMEKLEKAEEFFSGKKK